MIITTGMTRDSWKYIDGRTKVTTSNFSGSCTEASDKTLIPTYVLSRSVHGTTEASSSELIQYH